MTVSEYAKTHQNPLINIPLINEFWTAERAWRVFVYRHGARKLYCVSDMVETAIDDFFVINDKILRGIINTEMPFIRNDFAADTTKIINYGKTDELAKSSGHTETKTHGGTDTVMHGGTDTETHGGTDTVTHGGTDTVTHGGTDTVTHGGTDTVTHGGSDITTNSATTFDNTTDFKNTNKSVIQHGETIGTAHGETIGTAHGETIGTSHGETIGTAHGETIGTRYGETIETQHGATITTSLSNNGSDVRELGGSDEITELKTGYNNNPIKNAVEYNNHLIFALYKILSLLANEICLQSY